MDEIKNYLERSAPSGTDVPALVRSLKSKNCERVLDPVFQAIGYESALQYAIMLKPASGEIIYARNPELLLTEPVLAWACASKRSYLIHVLVGPGVDVNKPAWGLTALQWVCRRCYYIEFCELLEYAGDRIDWSIQTAEGQNLLDLYKLSREEGWGWRWTQEQHENFRSEIEKRMQPPKPLLDSRDIDLATGMPGAFPSD